jgi:hypothetical protein
MICIYVFPGLVTWLPEQLYGNPVADGAAPVQLEAPPVGGFQEEETMR